ncbi:MAG: repair protein [Massilia sp.]|nr:repair protein [Massilia sp.]
MPAVPGSPLACHAGKRVFAFYHGTIGHSNRPIEEFIDLLRQNGIACLLDIRTVPKSRHNPQFAQDQLPLSLAQAGISYRQMPGLGGLRRPLKDSPNSGWRNTSFRGYADYMQTPEFNDNVEVVAALAASTRCVLMCAESVPWRCHRSMVGDALLARGIQVEHIINPGKRRPHTLTPFARVDGTRILYPPEETGEASGAEGPGCC